MSSRIVVLLPVLMLLPLAVVVLLVLAVTSRPDAQIGPATAAARRHAVTGGVLAVVAAVGAVALWSVLSGSAGGLLAGRLVAATFLVAAVVHTAVLALTEVTWPRPTGLRRSGLLVPRGVTDVVPRTALVVAAALGVLVVLTAVGGVVAADASGRALTRVVQGEGGAETWTRSPFPGAFYAVPVLVGLAVLTLLVVLTLRLVVSRPAVAGADPATDTALRRAGAHRVLRGAGAGTGLTLAGLLVTAGSAVRGGAGDSAGPEVLATGLLVAGGLAALTGLALLAVPAPRVPAPAPAAVPVPA